MAQPIPDARAKQAYFLLREKIYEFGLRRGVLTVPVDVEYTHPVTGDKMKMSLTGLMQEVNIMLLWMEQQTPEEPEHGPEEPDRGRVA